MWTHPLAALVVGALDLAFVLDHTALVGRGPSRHVEVWGTVALPDQARTLVVAYYAGERQHVVSVASMPSTRAADLGPVVAASLETLEPSEPEAPGSLSRTLTSVLLWGSAGLITLGVRLWRQRRSDTTPDSPEKSA